MARLLAIDPGRSKCGLVLCDRERHQVIASGVYPVETVLGQIRHWSSSSPIDQILLGNGTGSSLWRERLQEQLQLEPELMDERGTTLRARERYWQLWPPQGWRRLLPRGLDLPPVELDAIAALVMLEDHLGRPLEWACPPPIQNRARTVKV
ncbi:pre-16S rRNA-processing nuclease YqgF [Synechococcus sp. BS55D]|uniref:pre-16S rRNA-processing nuclease YqgF n=1 Tax=Synechococcus sp. BS55D TaxID=2055943 RepID=UPI0010399B27|nr:pre-16S rRNA-processing nuclease YqgF [Synechococcus sp. BS55D]TCD58291.1 resolvase [Synechococcus sp. BS55D]